MGEMDGMELNIEEQDKLYEICRSIRQLQEILILISLVENVCVDYRIVCANLAETAIRCRSALEDILGEVRY